MFFFELFVLGKYLIFSRKLCVRDGSGILISFRGGFAAAKRNKIERTARPERGNWRERSERQFPNEGHAPIIINIIDYFTISYIILFNIKT